MVRKGQPHPCRLPDDEVVLRQIIRNYKYNAEARGHEWALSLDEVKALVTSDCRYCGRKPEQEARVYYRGGKVRASFIGNGIDRIRNRDGYVAGNVASACRRCNHAKRDMELEEFKAWVAECYRRLHG